MEAAEPTAASSVTAWSSASASETLASASSCSLRALASCSWSSATWPLTSTWVGLALISLAVVAWSLAGSGLAFFCRSLRAFNSPSHWSSSALDLGMLKSPEPFGHGFELLDLVL